ncbi:hypothetical protein V491_08530 [Pseudogymnoascus sp. VKM F-3775]|nr:hypothetical protein V491_08530 [Pseudogymnoascus sp. VKM F-3775]
MDPSQQPQVGVEVRRLWVTKLSLRCVAAVACVIVVGCCFGSYYINVLPIGPAAAALLWNIAEGITLIVRRRSYKGIHPGACVGVDLVLWLAVGGMAGYQVALLVDTGDYSYYVPTVFYVAAVFGLIATYVSPPT